MFVHQKLHFLWLFYTWISSDWLTHRSRDKWVSADCHMFFPPDTVFSVRLAVLYLDIFWLANLCDLYISSDWLVLLMCYLWISSDWLALVMWLSSNFYISRSGEIYSTKSAKFLAYKMQWIHWFRTCSHTVYICTHGQCIPKGEFHGWPIYSILNPTVDEWKRCSWYSQATTCLTRSHLLGDRVQESQAKDKRKPIERWLVLFIQKTVGSGVPWVV